MSNTVDTAATADECVQTKNDETFSDKWDRISTVISALLYIAVGAAFPINVLIFRSVINFIIAPGFTADLLQPNIISFAVLGAAVFAASFCASSIIGLAVQRQVRRIRLLYFQAVLRQDISWFDTQSSGALIGRLTENVDNIGQGIGTKFGEALQNFSGFLTAIIIAFVVGWQLTLVACAMLPVITVQFILFAVLTRRFTSKEVEAYSLASSIAGEVLSFIRTVVAFGGEKKEVDRYTNALGGAVIFGIKKSMAMNGVMGGIWLSTFSSSALIFWYGIKLMVEEGYDSGTVITVFMNVLMGSFYLGNALPNIQHFIKAKALAEEVYGTIDHIPNIDKNAKGQWLPAFRGNIRFNNVSFNYPSRRNVTVLQDFNLTLESGKTVALVGPSGSGKSTIIQMLQRYYDPAKGQVFVDGVDVRELDLKWYRRQLGCVQQEPLLFEGTIAENIRLGNPEATTEEIEEAAKLANAHEFIIQMPRTYETMIAERGGGMSGGQKQRIAIARALVSKPSVLLLDEATSALDTRSERVVQEALEKASVGRTVVTVAHRLTTVRNADQIMVLDKGMIRESGTHDELVHLNGLYAAMLKNQKRSESKEEEDEQEDALEEGAAVAPARSPDEEGVLDQKIWQLARDGSEDDTLSESIASQHSSGQRSLLIFQSKLSKFKRSPLARILKLNRPELMYIVLGAICCIFAGGAQPAFAVLYSEVYQIFTLIGQPDEMQRQVNLIAGLMVLIGVIRFLSTLGSGYFFGVSGERLTTRVRSTYFRSIIRQEIGWFDRSENQAGALTAKLATEASSLKSLSGSSIGLILESLVLIVASLVIAFIYSWQLTLLFLVFMPLIILAGMMQAKRMTGKSRKVDDTVAVRCAQEVFYSYTVVTTLTLEDFFYDKYKKLLHESYKSDTKGNLMFSLAYALTQSVPMFSFAAVFTLGGYLIEQGTINVLALFRVFSVMNMGSQSLGRTASFISDIKRASRSSKVILQTMDRTPRIITEEGILPDKPFTGNITFKRVYFRYPTRREIRALKNFSFVVEPNQTVALVGQSGCGKSTLLQLVQRFYDPSDHGPDSGIFFDNWNLCDVKPEWTRRQIGIVSQEPNLFDMTLRENIAYGDNSREVSMEEVIEAARKANIHDYIASLPEGYETMAGQRGSRLSGGQKQRVAIARALLRKPVLLLLDEATSALDNESERVVQEALDAAAESRTTLVVAHRLTTVKDADEIVVLEGGRKIETGDPESLMLAKGAFYALHNVEAKH